MWLYRDLQQVSALCLLEFKTFISFYVIQCQGRERRMKDSGKGVGRRLLSFANTLQQLPSFFPACYLIPLECSGSHTAPVWWINGIFGEEGNRRGKNCIVLIQYEKRNSTFYILQYICLGVRLAMLWQLSSFKYLLQSE